MDAPLPAALQTASVPEGIRALLARLQSEGHEAFLVGGCVRDLLRGRAPKDWDVATQAVPQEVQRLFRRVVPTGIAHGTVTVLVPEGAVEVTTYRVERSYLDGRRPSAVEFRRDLVEDLARRDFTINAMAFDPLAGQLRDPFDGQGDLRKRVIRCVGVAAERFGEDGLRPLRAVRFATVLEFALDAETARAIPGALAVFEKVALERRRDELLKLLLAPAAARGLGLLRETGLLALLLPELMPAGDRAREERVGRGSPVLEVRLAALLTEVEDVEGALGRLRLPTRVADTVRRLLAAPLPAEAAQWSEAQIRRWLVSVGPEHAEAAVGVAAARGLDAGGRLGARVRQVVAARPPLAASDLALGGEEVMRILGIGPSPAVGAATRALLDAVLDDPSLNTPEALERILRSRT